MRIHISAKKGFRVHAHCTILQFSTYIVFSLPRALEIVMTVWTVWQWMQQAAQHIGSVCCMFEAHHRPLIWFRVCLALVCIFRRTQDSLRTLSVGHVRCSLKAETVAASHRTGTLAAGVRCNLNIKSRASLSARNLLLFRRIRRTSHVFNGSHLQ